MKLYETFPLAGKEKYSSFVNEVTTDVFEYLCTKYPQTKKGYANRALKEIIRPINNMGNFEYDMLRMSGIKFEYRESGDYTTEIMRLINYIVSLPDRKSENVKKEGAGKNTHFTVFERFFTNIFSSVYKLEAIHHDIVSNMLGANNVLDEKSKQKKSKEEEEYEEKVKSYTKFIIGRKTEEDTPLFSEDEIRSGNLVIKTPSILRIMAKWFETLESILEKAESNIKNRDWRFKSTEGEGKKLPQ